MSRAGRPRNFDRDKAIQEAMFLFWEHGYEATSLAMLKAELGGGISAPSFYAAFSSKEALFIEVVERYMTSYGRLDDCLLDDTLSPRQAVEAALRKSVKMQTDNSHPRGCLLVTAANSVSIEHAHIRYFLATKRDIIRNYFRCCIRKGLGEDPLSAPDIEVLATIFHGFLYGVTIQARDGASFEVINDSVNQIMNLWK